MVDVYVLRFYCDHSDTVKKRFLVTEDTTREELNVDEGIKYRTARDTLIFFSKNAALSAAAELTKLCKRMHTGVPNPRIEAEKERITSQHAEYVVNKPPHWVKTP